MRSVSLRLADLSKVTIPIGFVGENLHTQVKIDCLKMFEEYPTALATLTVKPAKGDPYPAVVTHDGDYVIWEVTDSDLINQGNGEIQLAFVVDNDSDDIIAKSYIGRIRVDRSIEPVGEIPEPIDNWLIAAEAALADIPATIESAVDTALQEAKDSGEFDGPPGQDGQDGHSPVVTASKSGCEDETRTYYLRPLQTLAKVG